MTARPQDGNVTYLPTHRPFVIYEGPKPDYARGRAQFEPLNDALAENLQRDEAVYGLLDAIGDYLSDGKIFFGFVAGCLVCIGSMIVAVGMLR